MKKRIGCLLITLLMVVLFVGVSVQADETIHVVLDGKSVEFDVPPQVINGRTMVPIRAIFEKMGASVAWDANTNSAICTKGDTAVVMTVDSMDMYINNQKQAMDVAPVVIDGRTLAPARYVAEAFGADVQWSEKNNTVVICSKDVFAYADYPDIPDLGRCYNLPIMYEDIVDGCRVLAYRYEDITNDEYYSYLYDNSASVLGAYLEEVVESADDLVVIGYTKSGESVPRYLVGGTYDSEGCMIFVVAIPIDGNENDNNTVTLYALDGRTIEVLEQDVPAYLGVGWYETLEETQQTMYAADGRTITIYKSAVEEYKSVGWYETLEEAQASKQAQTPTYTEKPYNPTADGYYYRTPTGKRYHLDPNCGGKNSYRTTNINGLTPCSKCAK